MDFGTLSPISGHVVLELWRGGGGTISGPYHGLLSEGDACGDRGSRSYRGHVQSVYQAPDP
eukprot:5159526-Amphidinium_carterae.1